MKSSRVCTIKAGTCSDHKNPVAPGLHNQAYFGLLTLQFSGALEIVALLLGDADLWASSDCTIPELYQFRKIASDCLMAIEQTPGCTWMINPILDVLSRVEKNHRNNMTMKGLCPWLL
jgi:hypothetical protein